MTRAHRRSYVTLGVGGRCAIWREDQSLQCLFTAYELTCLRRLSPAAVLEIGAPRAIRIGHDLRKLVLGDVVYAFYARANNSVKIGRTTNLPERWRRIELASGMLTQLLSVWHSPDSRELESSLFDRYHAARRVGEWFTPDPVIDDLRRWVAEGRMRAR